MLSSRRILKHNTVTLDPDNKVVIAIGENGDTDSDEESVAPQKIEESAQSKAAKILRRAERQAEEILSDASRAATEERETIVQSAKSEAEKIVSEAREVGYNEGLEQASAEANTIRADAKKVMDDSIFEYKQKQKDLEPEIVTMIIGIVEKLLGNVRDLNPDIVLNVIRQGFDAAAMSGEVTVYVSADDYDLVEAKKEELMAHTDGSVKLTVTKDLSLSPMDCVIETPYGNIDCSLGQQFDSLRANLTYILNTQG
ncbi:MAG: FliH/SctL family protein [Defluviitaleaceae bacterium]|nr:FliH/SctL family protein [Defluviitaleaceae bacterium]